MTATALTLRQIRRQYSFLSAAAIFGLLICVGCQGAVAAEPKRVLVLHSFGRDFKPWSEYAKSIREELARQSPWPLDITDYSLVTARSSDEDPEAAFVEYLRAVFAKRPLRRDCKHRRARSRLRAAAPATALCRHTDGAHRR